jgi:hypothetical protein
MEQVNHFHGRMCCSNPRVRLSLSYIREDLSEWNSYSGPNSILSTDVTFFFSLVGFTSRLDFFLESIFAKSGVPFRALRA